MDELLITVLVVVLLSLVGVMGDFFVKMAGLGKGMDARWLLLGAGVYALTAFGWFYVMKHAKLTTLGVFYTVSTVLFLTVLGVFCFKERIEALEVIGIVTGILSLVLLARFG